MFRPKRFPCLDTTCRSGGIIQNDTHHALNAKCLTIQSPLRGQILYYLHHFRVSETVKFVETKHTAFSSASFAGRGHAPGSRVIARKKLYAHKPKTSAKAKWMNGCSGVSAEDSEVRADQYLDGDGMLPLTSLVPQPYPTHTIDAAIIPEKYGL